MLVGRGAKKHPHFLPLFAGSPTGPCRRGLRRAAAQQASPRLRSQSDHERGCPSQGRLASRMFHAFFFFAKNISTLVVVFTLEQKCFVSLKSRGGYSVSTFSVSDWNRNGILLINSSLPVELVMNAYLRISFLNGGAGDGPMASCILSTHSTTEPHPPLFSHLFDHICLTCIRTKW